MSKLQLCVSDILSRMDLLLLVSSTRWQLGHSHEVHPSKSGELLLKHLFLKWQIRS